MREIHVVDEKNQILLDVYFVDEQTGVKDDYLQERRYKKCFDKRHDF